MSAAMPTLRELKSRAQLLKPSIKLGKAGATPAFLSELSMLLNKHGLVKIRFEGFKEKRKELSRELAAANGATLVLQVGHTAVLHKPPAA
jgi:RNA-binding protein YhbY